MTMVHQSLHDAAYSQGVRDGGAGRYDPPKGDMLVDFVWAPVNALAGDPSTQEVADATTGSYNAGHSAGANTRRG